MNARAISSVSSPPSDRSVSASRASIASDGWQHAKIRLPPLERVLERVLKGVLGEVEVAEDADQRREHLPVLFAEEPPEGRVGARGYPTLTFAPTGTTARTSMQP
jgi:hypothetical protein